jgi:tetratricopeptide (TPR) repeat protein
MSEDKKIVIDLDNINTRSSDDINELLQSKAYENILKSLKDKTESKRKDDIEECRTHNSIFIDGKRGSGKTFFLLNIQKYIAKNNKDLSNNLHFLKPIDPTLLHDNESFLTIIIAKILNNLEKSKRLSRLDDNTKKSFYHILSTLSESIDGVVNNKNHNKSTLEIISQDQSSLQLEQYCHQFFQTITEFTGTKTIILMIDDIDMSFEKGFEILEVVRKYLSSPYIIPIITGDLAQYDMIVNKNFIEKSCIDRCNEINHISSENQKKHIKELSTNYLVKIFEIQSRIEILNLYGLLETYDLEKIENNKLQIRFKYNESEYTIYTILEDYIIKYFRLSDTKESEQILLESFLQNQLRQILQFLKYLLEQDSQDLQKLEQQDSIEKDFLISKLKEDYNVILYKNGTSVEYINLAKEFISKNEHQKALESCNKAIEVNPKSNEAYFYKANAYLSQNEPEKAIENYKKAIELSPKNDQAYYNIGIAYRMLEQHEKAIENYKKAIELNPKNSQAYCNIGIIYNEIEQFDQALENLEQAIKLDSNDDKAYGTIGLVFNNIKQFDKALENIQQAIKLNPNVEQHYNNLGIAYGGLKQFEKEIESYKKAIEVKPKYDKAFLNMGITYQELNNYEKAIESYKKAIELNPKDNQAYYNMGNAYNELKQYEKAIESYKKAIELNPKLDQAYYNMGIAYNELKQYEKAIESYKKAIELNPKKDEAYYNMGIAYGMLEQYEKEIESYKKAIELNPKDILVYYTIFHILEHIKIDDKLKKDIKSFLKSKLDIIEDEEIKKEIEKL